MFVTLGWQLVFACFAVSLAENYVVLNGAFELPSISLLPTVKKSFCIGLEHI